MDSLNVPGVGQSIVQLIRDRALDQRGRSAADDA